LTQAHSFKSCPAYAVSQDYSHQTKSYPPTLNSAQSKLWIVNLQSFVQFADKVFYKGKRLVL
jgi:hypothetical protein